MRSAPRPGWLVSPSFDAAFVLGPTWLAGLATLLIPHGTPLPAWGWLLFVLGIDVAHVWATLYRTYLDPAELSRRPLLYAAAPVVALVGCLSLNLLAPWAFWRVLAYLAVFHFIRQAVGIGVLFRARSGRPVRDRAGQLERLATYAVTLGPVLWWHTALPLPFEWFVPGDFVALPRWMALPIALASGSLALAHVICRVRERRLALASDAWWLGTALVWVGGICWARSDAAFTISNVVAHGVPYAALVWWTARRRWEHAETGALHPAVFAGWGLPVFLGLLLGLAFAEEALWDLLVWQERPDLFGSPEALLGAWGPRDGAILSWTPYAVAVLSVPQVTHYLLDGFVWKMGPKNPELRALLGLEPARTAQQRQERAA